MSTSTPTKLIKDLSNILGLDGLTIKEQIWPQLTTLNSALQVSQYLEGLLGSGSAAKTFISTYNTSRFATTLPPPPATGSVQSSSNWAAKQSKSQPSSSSSRNQQSHSALLEIEQQRRALIEKEFEGSGGKVYQKNREEDFGYGGGGGSQSSKNNSRNVSRNGSRGVSPARSSSSSVTPIPPPLAQLQPNRVNTAILSRTLPQQVSKKKEEEGPAVLVPLSMKGTMELLEIDRVLKTFQKGKGPVRECFCQARQHDLSIYSPSCPKCALVLCHLNLPVSPCPSCSFSPLLSPLSISTYTESLKSQRDIIIQRETLRIAREKVQEEAEKAAIRFPTLANGSSDLRGANNNNHRAYSNMAGAGPDLNERIEMAYNEGKTLNGKNFGRNLNEPSIGRVLKLDMKTKKVKIQSKVVKKILKEVKVQEKIESGQVEFEQDEEEEDDGFGTGWIDEKDDGYLARPTTTTPISLSNPSEKSSRPFINLTLDENSRPVWEEEIILEEEEEQVTTNDTKVVPKGFVPGAAIKVAVEGGETKKKSRSKVKKGTGVV